MRYIAHRGNLNGSIPEKENTIAYLSKALDAGFDVELDICSMDDVLYLGHDVPQEKLPDWFFQTSISSLWFHAKDSNALRILHTKYRYTQHFWHNTDDYTLTSNGYIWVYPGKPLIKNSIAVLPEQEVNGNLNQCYAICTDMPIYYKNLLG